MNRTIDRVKVKDRIRRFLSTGKPQARVYLTSGTRGYYRVGPGNWARLPFRFDRLGRIYVWEKKIMR